MIVVLREYQHTNIEQMIKWYWISLPYATFGIRTTDGIVDVTAPIARWMIGKHINYIANWVKSKGGIGKQIN
jgi:hypothetical protein